MIAGTERDVKFALVLSDTVALLVAILLTVLLRFNLGVSQITILPRSHPWSVVAPLAGLIVVWYVCLRGTRSYDFCDTNWNELFQIFKGSALFVLLVLAIAFFSWTLFSRGAVLLFVPIAALTTFSLRRFLVPLFLRIGGRKEQTRVLVVGHGPAARRLEAILRSRIGYEVNLVEFPETESLAEQMPALLDQYKPQEVVLVHTGRSFDSLVQILNIFQRRKVPWQFVPTIDQLVLSNVHTYVLGGMPVMGVKTHAISGFNALFKHVIDFTLGSAIMFCTAPLMALIWLLVRLSSKGPAIVVQQRVGYKGRKFNFYKFRTMYVDNDDSKHREYVKSWIKNKPYSSDNGSKTFKIVHDNRITPIGRILRRYSLDELPQIINVLKRDMSLVGPRPALAYELEMYEEWHKERLEVLPGLTGLWQVGGRNNISFDEMVKLDIEYLRNWSASQDFKLLIRTVPAILFGTGH